MTGWEVFLVYQPLHLHFTTSYDIFKYGKKAKSISFESFNSRNDRAIFEQVAKKAATKEKAAGLCLANFIQSDKWIYEELSYAWSIYELWVKNRINIRENVEHDLNVLSQVVQAKKVESFDDIFTKTKSGGLPPLLQLYQIKKVLPETVCFLDSTHGFLSDWVGLVANDPLAATNTFKLTKYVPFCNFTKLEGLAVNV